MSRRNFLGWRKSLTTRDDDFWGVPAISDILLKQKFHTATDEKDAES
jgi:hypothetical protein